VSSHRLLVHVCRGPRIWPTKIFWRGAQSGVPYCWTPRRHCDKKLIGEKSRFYTARRFQLSMIIILTADNEYNELEMISGVVVGDAGDAPHPFQGRDCAPPPVFDSNPCKKERSS